MKCRLCLNDNPRLLFVAQDIHGRQVLSNDKFDVFQCDACKVTFTAVNTNDDYYKKYYLEDYYPSICSNGLISKALFFLQEFSFKQRLKLIERYKMSGGNRMLEIGCGRGEFLNFLPAVFKKYAIEINEKGCKYIKDHYKDISVYNIHIDDESVKVDEYGQFDCIIMWHVLEHIVNPSVFVRNLSKLLKKDGIIVLEVPNRDSLGFNIAKKRWFHLDVPRHIFHYTYESIGELFGKNSLEIIRYSANAIDYPQDLPVSFYAKFKTKNVIINCLFFIFVLPIATIVRVVVALLAPKRSELNAYVLKNNGS